METLILYVEESGNDANTIDKNAEPRIKYSIQGCNSDICRLCLDLSQLQPISSCQFIKEFNNFMFIEVQLGVRFPKNVCEKCINQLNEMASFLKMCQNSLNTYKKMEENCAKLRATNNENEAVEQVEVKSPINNVETEEFITELAVIAEESTGADDEPQFVEMAIAQSREESINTDSKVTEPIISYSYEATMIEKKVPENVPKPVKLNKKLDPKMCYTCGTCVTSLSIHYKINTSCRPKNIKCPLCNLRFTTKRRMVSHQRVTHWDKISTKPLICQLCSKIFQHPETLKRHVRNHVNGKEYMCEICGKSYARSENLRDHINVHNNLKPYACKYCEKSFNSKTYHFQHELRHQKANSRLNRTKTVEVLTKTVEVLSIEIFVCHICSKEFSNQVDLSLHMHSHFNDDQSSYECRQCNIQFENTELYRKHSEKRSQKFHACVICEKRFSTSFCLRKHMRFHTGERPYSCSTCGSKFHTNGNLKRHILLIHNVNLVKPFECQFCEKTFNVKENLLAHERIHTGDRLYRCHICDKGFMENSYRKKHIRRVHQDEVGK